MRVVCIMALTAASLTTASAQDAKSTNQAKITEPLKAAKAKKETKATPPVTFEAHNEGSVEGAIYGLENLISVTIDSTGIQYKDKSMDKPVSISWAQVSGWQANNFTSRSPGRSDDGDFGIGIYQGARYFSFRTRKGRDYLAAIKILRTLATAKERPGIG